MYGNKVKKDKRVYTENGEGLFFKDNGQLNKQESYKKNTRPVKERLVNDEDEKSISNRERLNKERPNKEILKNETRSRSARKPKVKKKKSRVGLIIAVILVIPRIFNFVDGFIKDDTIEYEAPLEADEVEESFDNQEAMDTLEEEGIDISDKILIESTEYFETAEYYIPSSISASSTLQTNLEEEFSPVNITDFDLTTAWSEGVEGNGRGEWIQLDFDEEITVHGIETDYGYQESYETYDDYSNPTLIRVEFSGDRYIYIGNEPEFDFEYINVVELDNVKTSFIRFVIIDVLEGQKYEDTCISEMKVY